MKFSFLVPVYNGQHYIEKCLNSLLNQTYKKPYEIIVVDDGSKDDTYKILKKIQKNNNNIKVYRRENHGISSTRNYLVSKCNSDYFIFVDSDDYVDKNLLKEVNKNIKNSRIDILKYQTTIVDVNGNTIKQYEGDNFNLSGQEAFKTLVHKKNFFDVVWMYAFNKKFWMNHNFQFYDKLLHEDFGLIPYVILCAKKIVSINYNGYFYVQTNNSIMRTNNDEKEIIKAKHLLILFDNLKKNVYKLKLKKEVLDLFNSYAANALLLKANSVPAKYLNEYISELKKREVYKLLLNNSIIRKIKKMCVKYNIKLYINIQRKKTSY